MSKAPVIGVTTCVRAKHEATPELKELAVGQKYLRPLLDRGALPLPIPNFGIETPFDALTDMLDGLLLTGSMSNVHPHRYQAEVGPRSHPLDETRDACVWGLLDRMIAAGKPVFAVCRGFQELNVYFGGSLHQSVHETPGFQDHRCPTSDLPNIKYGAWQKVVVTEGGALSTLLGSAEPVRVNSLHLQGLDRLGEGLKVEARAEDGLVEAVSAPDASGFCLGVQWHPEAIDQNPVSQSLFDGFVDACRAGR